MLNLKIIGNRRNYIYTVPEGINDNKLNITVLFKGTNFYNVYASKSLKYNPSTTNFKIMSYEINNDYVLTIKSNVLNKYSKHIVGKNRISTVIKGKNVNKKINNNITDGVSNIKINLSKYPRGNYSVQLVFRENKAYTSSKSEIIPVNLIHKEKTKTFLDIPLKVKKSSTLNLRAYVTYNDNSRLKTIENGTVTFKLNNKNIGEANVKNGKAILKYYFTKNGKQRISAVYNGILGICSSITNKNIMVTDKQISKSDLKIKGNKDPKTTTIPLLNGKYPNLVYMTNYVWADENATYSLTKKQYEEVLDNDKYCLYLNKHLSQYVSFKTKNESNIYHVLRREKWNVIEKEMNRLLITKNTMTKPESITVNLDGKEYTYSELRDKQDFTYTCCPTSASVCSQALRNYVNEQTFNIAFETYKDRGTYAKKVLTRIKKYNFTASYIYQNGFNSALDKLSNGGCSIIFYTPGHYVAIIDISPDKSKVLVANPYGDYNYSSCKIPNGWVSVSYMKTRFGKDNFAGLLIQPNYSLSPQRKNQVNNLYKNMGTNWIRKNTNELIKM